MSATIEAKADERQTLIKLVMTVEFHNHQISSGWKNADDCVRIICTRTSVTPDPRPSEEYRIISSHIHQTIIAMMGKCDGVIPTPARQLVINSNSVELAM